ncbi:hypothetical protein WH95_18365 [Kiloniella litopenaei]|uniref:Uncharacterized protein n=1 Tax=Kiloniella litopenaei TaxID=1549748 RepID=A0A0M2R190_9PROT|nr:hypothetical protein WH95_18365 [Kiloniella litopenaei]
MSRGAALLSLTTLGLVKQAQKNQPSRKKPESGGNRNQGSQQKAIFPPLSKETNMFKQIIAEARQEISGDYNPKPYRKKRKPRCPRCTAYMQKKRIDGQSAWNCPRHGIVRFIKPKSEDAA